MQADVDAPPWPRARGGAGGPAARRRARAPVRTLELLLKYVRRVHYVPRVRTYTHTLDRASSEYYVRL